MKRLFVTACGAVAWGLAVAAMVAISVSAKMQNAIGLGGASPWPMIVLSVVLLFAGLSTLDKLVVRTDARPPVQANSDLVSPITIAIFCCLGLLISLCVAMLGFDLSAESIFAR